VAGVWGAGVFLEKIIVANYFNALLIFLA